MAWVQARNGSYRVSFRYQGAEHSFWLGRVHEQEARATAAKVDYWLMRLKQNVLRLPAGCGVVDFVRHDGKPPDVVATRGGAAELTLGDLRDLYLKAQAGKLEETTLIGMRLHFGHLVRALGEKRLVVTISRIELQGYVDQRAGQWIDPNVYRKARRGRTTAQSSKGRSRKLRSEPHTEADRPVRHPSPATIKKEIVSLRTAWNWARRYLDLKETFPGGGLGYGKVEQALPFMTWEEAECRIAAGGDPQRLWECVYLRPKEVAELLGWVKQRPLSPWVYPMLVFAAHTGTRRSEMVRAEPSDLDLARGFVTIREKKRDSRRLTNRRVPLTSVLTKVARRMAGRQGGGTKTLLQARRKRHPSPRSPPLLPARGEIFQVGQT